GLTAGAHSYRAVITDEAGNEGTTSSDFTLTVVPDAPTAIAQISSITDDTGTSATDFITSDTSLVVTATVTGSVAAGERVQISLDDGTSWLDATQVGASNSYTVNTGVLAAGRYTFQARVINAAGEYSTPGEQVVLIDTTAPTSANAVAI